MGADTAQEQQHDRYALLLGDRLRRVRQQQGRSLHEVEADSGGEFKASVVGAYERGERAVSITRLQRLAGFYHVPVAELLPALPPAGAVVGEPGPEVVIDLAALERERDVEPALRRYATAIQARRGDYNGRVLTVRGGDLEMLAAVLDARVEDLRARFGALGVVR